MGYENYTIDWESDRSVDNWLVKFDLLCEPDWKKAMPGCLFFIGFALSTFWLSAYSDIYGRKNFFLLAMTVNFCMHIGMWLTSSWSVISALAFCCGFTTVLRLQVGYNYLIELFSVDRQVLVGLGWCITDALVYVITTLYFWKINHEWQKYFSFVLCANLIGLIGAVWLPESPRMLQALGRENEAMDSLNRIAKINKMEPPFPTVSSRLAKTIPDS